MEHVLAGIAREREEMERERRALREREAALESIERLVRESTTGPERAPEPRTIDAPPSDRATPDTPRGTLAPGPAEGAVEKGERREPESPADGQAGKAPRDAANGRENGLERARETHELGSPPEADLEGSDDAVEGEDGCAAASDEGLGRESRVDPGDDLLGVEAVYECLRAAERPRSTADLLAELPYDRRALTASLKQLRADVRIEGTPSGWRVCREARRPSAGVADASWEEHARLVYDYVARHPGSLAPEIQVATQLGVEAFRRAVTFLRDRELLRSEGQRRGMRYYPARRTGVSVGSADRSSFALEEAR